VNTLPSEFECVASHAPQRSQLSGECNKPPTAFDTIQKLGAWFQLDPVTANVPYVQQQNAILLLSDAIPGTFLGLFAGTGIPVAVTERH